MREHLYSGVVGLIFACLLASTLSAQEQDFEPRLDMQPPGRKQPGVFHRPGKETPSEQLKYARALYDDGEIRKAMKQYRALVHQWHDTDDAVLAQEAYAKLLQEKGKYFRAFDEFQYLIDNYSGKFPYKAVIERQFQIANHIRTAKRRVLFILNEYTSPERALPMFEKIVDNAPNWDKAPEAQFCLALIHEQGKDYEEAAKAYEELQSRWPDSDFVNSAGYRRAECLYYIAREKPRDEIKCRSALSAFSAFLRDYPDDNDREKVQQYIKELSDQLADSYYERALFYDRTGRKPEAAFIAYSDFVRNCPASDMIEKAKERIAELESEIARVSSGKDKNK